MKSIKKNVKILKTKFRQRWSVLIILSGCVTAITLLVDSKLKLKLLILFAEPKLRFLYFFFFFLFSFLNKIFLSVLYFLFN